MTRAELAALLRPRLGNEDWIAALAKAAVVPRADVEAALAGEGPLPRWIVEAAGAVETETAPGRIDRSDHVFAARTNDVDAPMEVDAEAGMTVAPGAKMAPSETGSPHEMGERPGTLDPDQR
jgi:hypothetical protein